ncbi:MAG TPA: TonB-dependent receptor plug domain-containing protein [Ignavibacteria bacterium]|nr:TonB-dependent receptor plug domain-containing protein [Ignavibacteria bacterium]
MFRSNVWCLIVLTIFIYCDESRTQPLSRQEDTTRFITGEIKVMSNKIISNEFRTFSKIQLISKDQIENTNGERLSDILNFSNGVFIKSYGGNSSLNTISIGGSASEHTLILLNGFKLNSDQNNQIDISAISKDNIRKIEILNSGAGSIYGSQAMSGVINIITEQNADDKLGVRFTGQTGSYGLKKFYTGISKKFYAIETRFGYTSENSLNNYDYFFFNGAENELKQRNKSGYDFKNYTISLNYNQFKKTSLSFYSDLSLNKRNIPGIETGSDPSNAEQSDKNWNNIITVKTVLSDKFNFKAQINFQNNLSHYSDFILTDSYYKNISFSGSVFGEYSENRLKVTGGYDYGYSSLNSNEISEDAVRNQNSFFLLSEIDFSSALKIFPSVRADFTNDPSCNAVTGKLGINIKPISNKEFYVKAAAGNNFSLPTFNALYWKDLGNRHLNPESSFNIDAGFIYGFSFFTENKLELTFNHINYKDKIIWTPGSNGLWTPENNAASVSNVFLAEISMRKQLSRALSLDLNINYSFTSAQNKSNDNPEFYDKQLIYIPVNMLKSSLSLNYKNTGINIFYCFTDKRFTDRYNNNFLPGYDVTDGNIFYTLNLIGVKSTLRIDVNNIFNENYKIISGYPMPLRNFKISVNLEY